MFKDHIEEFLSGCTCSFCEETAYRELTAVEREAVQEYKDRVERERIESVKKVLSVAYLNMLGKGKNPSAKKFLILEKLAKAGKINLKERVV